MRRGKARKKIRSYLTANLGFGIDVHARKSETMQVVHQERWNCSPFLVGKENEHESYDMEEDDFCRLVKQCGNSSRGSGNQGGGAPYPSETAKHADV